MDPVAVWPLFALRLRTPRLTLRPVRDDDLPGIAELAERGVHPPERMPFAVPWTRATGSELRRSIATHHWRLRAGLSRDDWAVSFLVERDGEPIGAQDLSASHLATLRSVATGSWLGRSFQGQGFGSEMRAAVLTLAFDHLGAQWAESGAAVWNRGSLRVSEKLGYTPNGITRTVSPDGSVFEEQRMRLHVGAFVRPSWALEIDGLQEARAQLLD